MREYLIRTVKMSTRALNLLNNILDTINGKSFPQAILLAMTYTTCTFHFYPSGKHIAPLVGCAHVNVLMDIRDGIADADRKETLISKLLDNFTGMGLNPHALANRQTGMKFPTRVDVVE